MVRASSRISLRISWIELGAAAAGVLDQPGHVHVEAADMRARRIVDAELAAAGHVGELAEHGLQLQLALGEAHHQALLARASAR